MQRKLTYITQTVIFTSDGSWPNWHIYTWKYTSSWVHTIPQFSGVPCGGKSKYVRPVWQKPSNGIPFFSANGLAVDRGNTPPLKVRSRRHKPHGILHRLISYLRGIPFSVEWSTWCTVYKCVYTVRDTSYVSKGVGLTENAYFAECFTAETRSYE